MAGGAGMSVEIDFETRSAVDLRKHGVYNYMSSPTTQPLMASFKINGGPVQRWRPPAPCPPAPCPPEIVAHVTNGGMISAHNAGFERLLWQMVLTPRYGWPAVKTEQFRCTAATAAAMALPRDLAGLGAALDLDVQKDTEGKRLIRKFCVPRRPRKGEDPNGLYWNEPEDHPEDFERFHDYCDIDVETEAAADRRMVPLSADEQDLYVLSERINDRGIRIDVTSAKAALAMAEKAKKLLDRKMRLVTGGYVPSCSNPGKLVEWGQAQGVEMTSAAKADIDELLALDDLPEAVREAIELRQEAAKTSVSKLQAMLDRAGDDGRVRGTFMYHGASTGRWTSMGVNFANLPRNRRVYEDAKLNVETLFQAFRSEEPELLPLLYGPELGRPLHLISDAIRGFIWSAPGHELIQADYSGIEGAVAAWLANEQWKLKVMHDIIADPSIPDMYRQTAAGIMNSTTDVITKKHPLRQSVGKTSELALGFGGGVSAFYTMAKGYGVDLDALYAPVWQIADETVRERATKRYEKELRAGKSRTDVLSREAWIACEIIKVGWRATNPAIAGAWKDCEAAIRDAVRAPGATISTLKLTEVVKMGFLWCLLPSGRCLAYGSPKLKDQVWACVKDETGAWLDAEVLDRDHAEKLVAKGEAKIEGETSPKATVLGVNGVTRKWERYALYGGLAFQNAVQAIARDLLVNGMRKAEAAGYPVIAHVYDEMICEVPQGFGDLAEFEKLICELPEWAAGMPLTAGGFRAKRYRKD